MTAQEAIVEYLKANAYTDVFAAKPLTMPDPAIVAVVYGGVAGVYNPTFRQFVQVAVYSADAEIATETAWSLYDTLHAKENIQLAAGVIAVSMYCQDVPHVIAMEEGQGADLYKVVVNVSILTQRAA